MPLATSLSLVLDAKQSVELLFGGAAQVWNLFSKNRLQPAASVYFANCALYGGDSDGWRESLRSFSVIRSTRGFQIKGDKYLSIGFPGADILPALLETEFGSRWLGLLSVLATTADQHNGALNLDQFIRKTASDPTRKFILDRESCERLWTLSREIFAGSAYWYNFLEITSSILVHLRVPGTSDEEFATDLRLLNLIFPESTSLGSGQFLSNTMTAAFGLWQLSKKPESKGKSLWARGGTGCAQLIFYLTVVCGFFVRLGTGDGSTTFGDQNSGQAEITIEIVLRDIQTPWEIGYLLENDPIDRSVRTILPTLANDDTWRLTLVPDTERSTSKYRVDKNAHSSQTGQLLLPFLNAVKKDIASYNIVSYVSHWFSDMLHNYLHFRLLRKEEWNPGSGLAEEKSLSRAVMKSERLRKAIEVFAPGVLTDEDQEELIKKMRQLQTPEPVKELHNRLPKHMVNLCCDCPSHGNKHDEASSCKFKQIADMLEDTAIQVWACTYVATNPEYLRDIRPNLSGHWDMARNPRELMERGEFYAYPLDSLLRLMAMRLAGHKMEFVDDCVGRVAGGFVIGVFGNEDLAISQDQGHSIYIEPGGIATQERHYKQVIQSTEVNPIEYPTETKSRFIFDFTTPQDCFSDAVLKHNVQISGDTAILESLVYQNWRRLYKLNPRVAIDRSVTVRTIEGCLGECLKGNLTESDLSKVAIDLPDKTHYTSSPGVRRDTGLDESERDALSGREGRLTVFPAHGNVLVQRAVISQPALEKVAILTGTCVHCAIKQSLEEGMQALIC